ncbi:retinal guanylyl cyclase 1 [Bicyclus anynana]|uniref:Guanylate cyclase n=1 Tax=Bicyclus anynana TaxID=110368 RepID=A0ABM3M7U6_BICAN|nr:retinal guanylyl cyclase 1 [Bicyclus anynana]
MSCGYGPRGPGPLVYARSPLVHRTARGRHGRRVTAMLLPALLLLPLLRALPAAPPARFPLLLVARRACGARLALAQLERLAAASPRLTRRPLEYQLLSHEETCGPQWAEALTRRALAALAAGGGVAAAGELGARACGALLAAAGALRRPRPAPCAVAAARGAALALLARTLRWQRVLLAPARGDERAPPPPRTVGDRRPSSISRSHAPEDDRGIVVSVVVVCYSSTSAPAPPGTAALAPDVLLLRVADAGPEPSAAAAGVLDFFEESFPPGAPVQRNSWDSIDRGERTPAENATGSQIGPFRLLLFAEEAPEAASPYDDILEAAVRHEEARRTGVEVFSGDFVLYESDVVGGNATWTRLAKVSATARQPLGAPWAWSAALAAGGGELARRGAEEAGAERARAPALGLLVCAASATVALLAAAAAACARRVAARRAPHRPRAAPVLAAADFQFPADDRRRVGEGMESMLSWLQRLHDVGEAAPAPDAPRRAEPLVPSAPSSTCSVSRLAPDARPRYKGEPVHVKPLPAAALELRRAARDVLLVMQGLRHENVNPFLGCLAELRPALVWAACARGSLEDVLMADEVALDWTFRLSLLTDLVRGMRYLHRSPVRLHARLSSRNCVVDARWVLRVTDYGLPALAAAQALPYAPRRARELLWTAPELLREARAASVPGGSQAGDVFSFGIIMQEVIVRGEPYCMLPLSPEELLEKLRRPPPLVRPSVSLGAAPPDAVAVMRQCWSEQPELRPDFARLDELFQRMHRGRKTNIIDSMFEMLEKYSNNLEELIKERTEQLDMEKKKTEQLLNRMLPGSVAERLLLGLRVEPEEFEDVSVYFSDIVGFTALAARSTPVQVVDLLNDLYTTFDAAIEQYRVYKVAPPPAPRAAARPALTLARPQVETIGDAYMVVGGLPLRCRDHAERVATMALHLLHLAGRFRIRHLPGAPLHLRSGLHSGPCCAGVVGLTMPRYCLFGDTVNTAARMESTGAAWRVQLSGATAARLAAAGGFRLRARGLTQVKGKGAMLTHWLLGKDGFDRPLPVPPPLEFEEVLLEADGESEPEARLERQRSDPGEPPGAAGPRSGAASAESSPPPAPRRPRYLRASASTVAALAEPPGARALRRQWSLERGDALAAAAAGGPALEPLALRAPPPRAAPPRYRTRRGASSLDVSAR